MGDIAAELGGTTRAAVGGKLKRLHLLKARPQIKMPVREKVDPIKALVESDAWDLDPTEHLVIEPEPAWLEQFKAMQPRACRWPYSHVGCDDFRFCAEATIDIEHSYCGEHMKLAYVKAPHFETLLKTW